MIVRILSSSASFHGVSYNTDKIDRGLGELMKVSGFGALQGLTELRPEDYRNELKAVSALNKAIKSPQFHAAISAPGKTYDRYQLTAIAEEWLKAMGYGNQPYLIVFHQDTANNHVHVVSTRINKEGKQINRDFEYIRSVQQLNRVMGLDEKHSVTVDIEKALAYRFATIAQFKMILENQGYTLKEESGQLQVIKFGTKLADLSIEELIRRLNNDKPDAKRTTQLKAILMKYAKVYDSTIKQEIIPLPGRYGKPTGNYTSELAAHLKEKHGLILIFHASENKQPYGYSLIDHSRKAVYKGSEIMPLKDLLAIEVETIKEQLQDPVQNLMPVDEQSHSYYSALLKAVINNYPDIRQGLHHQGLDIRYSGHELELIDFTFNHSVPVKELLNEADYEQLQKEFAQSQETSEEINRQYHAIPSVSLATDVDDEAVHNRKRKGKNSRR
ncbi:relaxase/mobilization nuclease domain-containing protein [Mucilaginibacter sp. Mucisp84]|uniref:relaxase/mobilization nuclease domain-containing protein n=1 Tax=Mucilaginibacter sp. Mucisp84 TaxID=3243058 RepID=UPI0039A64CC4